MLIRVCKAFFMVHVGVGAYNVLHWVLFPRMERVLAQIPLSARAVVDIGCGTGIYTLAAALRRPELHILGIDLQTARVQAAFRAGRILNVTNAEFRQGDVLADDLPQADAFLVCDVLLYLPFDAQVDLLRRLKARLNNGGSLVIKTHDASLACRRWCLRGEERLARWLRRGLGTEPYAHYYRSRLFVRSSSEWQRLMRDLGFAVEIHPLHRGLPLPHLLLVATPRRGGT